MMFNFYLILHIDPDLVISPTNQASPFVIKMSQIQSTGVLSISPLPFLLVLFSFQDTVTIIVPLHFQHLYPNLGIQYLMSRLVKQLSKRIALTPSIPTQSISNQISLQLFFTAIFPSSKKTDSSLWASSWPCLLCACPVSHPSSYAILHWICGVQNHEEVCPTSPWLLKGMQWNSQDQKAIVFSVGI